MEKLAARLWQEEQGQALTEYALLLVLIFLAAVSTVGNLASTVNDVYSRATADIAGCQISMRADSGRHSGDRMKETSSQFHWDWYSRIHSKVGKDGK